MFRKKFGELICEATEVDIGYAEIDPTGRYGRFKEVLGKGAMKTVYKAMDELLGIEVAWNQVMLNDVLQSPEELQRLYSEVHLLSTLNHDSIIRFYTSWIDVDHKTFNFITEMFTSGSLREYRRKYKRVDIRAIKSWVRQILLGLVYLHEHDPPVIHRDLKCDNIFVNGHLGQIKIGDLGLATILQGSQSAHSMIGTPEFMAPELYEEDYNELVDVYSFGMCVLEMLTSDYPYSECTNPAQIYKKVTTGKLPSAFYRVKDLEAQRFIGKCLLPAPKRLSAKELLLDPFLASEVTKPLPLTNIGNQKSFLNERELEKLHMHDDPLRTDMKITGKLNAEDDTIFLRVQITDKYGCIRNVYFPFDVQDDTPTDVAMEMVKELEISDLEPLDIAEMIDGEISSLVPNWKQLHVVLHHELEDKYDDDFHHLFHSSSSCSSSHVSLPSLTTHGYDWLQDDTSSRSPSHSVSYSYMDYFSGDEHNIDANLTRPEKHSTTTRFCHEENHYNRQQTVARNAHRQCNAWLESNQASSPKNKKVIIDNKWELQRNRSLVDIRSQLLHRSLVEEANRRRLFNTVGAAESIGFQAPCEVSMKAAGSSLQRTSR